MTLLRRVALIGTLATVVDVVGVVLLAAVVGWPIWWANATAVAAATVLSWGLHAVVTPSTDPTRGWFNHVGTYWFTAAVALVVDVSVLTLLVAATGPSTWWQLLPLKAASLLAAFMVRMVNYRDTMFNEVRGQQAAPMARAQAPGSLRLSVVVPAYREADRIADTIARIRSALAPLADAGELEIVVVDDGSGDNTAATAEAAGADVVVRCEVNRGKGAAVRTGVLASSGRTVAFTDADLSYAPEQLAVLLDGVEAGWDVVVGSRRHVDTRTVVRAGRLREVGGRVINLFTGIVLLGRYQDTQCGLKAMRSDVGRVIFERSQVDGFAFDVEVLHLIERYKMSLLEVPVEVVNSSRSTVNVARDATRLLRDLFRIRRWARTGRYDAGLDGSPPLTG